MYCLRNELKEKWINNYVDRGTAVAKLRIQDANAAIEQEPHDMRYAPMIGNVGTI